MLCIQIDQSEPVQSVHVRRVVKLLSAGPQVNAECAPTRPCESCLQRCGVSRHLRSPVPYERWIGLELRHCRVRILIARYYREKLQRPHLNLCRNAFTCKLSEVLSLQQLACRCRDQRHGCPWPISLRPEVVRSHRPQTPYIYPTSRLPSCSTLRTQSRICQGRLLSH